MELLILSQILAASFPLDAPLPHRPAVTVYWLHTKRTTAIWSVAVTIQPYYIQQQQQPVGIFGWLHTQVRISRSTNNQNAYSLDDSSWLTRIYIRILIATAVFVAAVLQLIKPLWCDRMLSSRLQLSKIRSYSTKYTHSKYPYYSIDSIDTGLSSITSLNRWKGGALSLEISWIFKTPQRAKLAQALAQYEASIDNVTVLLIELSLNFRIYNW